MFTINYRDLIQSISFISEESESNATYIIRNDRETENEIELDDNKNKNFMKQKDIKYDLYPFYINWKKLELNEDYYYKIFAKFGYYGVAVYSSLNKVRNDITPRNILIIISSFYYDYFYLDSNTNTISDNFKQILFGFIKLFPDLNETFNLIKNKIILFRESPMIILILKINEFFYLFTKNYDKLFQLMKYEFIFHSYLSDEEYINIYRRYFRGSVEYYFGKVVSKMGKLYMLPRNKNSFIKHLKQLNKLIKKEKEEKKENDSKSEVNDNSNSKDQNNILDNN